MTTSAFGVTRINLFAVAPMRQPTNKWFYLDGGRSLEELQQASPAVIIAWVT